MTNLNDIKKMVEENCLEISKNDFWNTYNWEFKGTFARKQKHYNGYNFDLDNTKVWVHSNITDLIVSIGNKYYVAKDYENQKVLAKFFDDAAKEKYFN